MKSKEGHQRFFDGEKNCWGEIASQLNWKFEEVTSQKLFCSFSLSPSFKRSFFCFCPAELRVRTSVRWANPAATAPPTLSPLSTCHPPPPRQETTIIGIFGQEQNRKPVIGHKGQSHLLLRAELKAARQSWNMELTQDLGTSQNLTSFHKNCKNHTPQELWYFSFFLSLSLSGCLSVSLTVTRTLTLILA